MDWFDFDWDDWCIMGGLSEEISDEERERRKIEKDFDDEDLDQDEGDF